VPRNQEVAMLDARQNVRIAIETLRGLIRTNDDLQFPRFLQLDRQASAGGSSRKHSFAVHQRGPIAKVAL